MHLPLHVQEKFEEEIRAEIIRQQTEEELKNNDRWSDRSVWCLDHDHNTLEIRGWVCNNCNIAIGRLHDSPEIAMRAYEYLIYNR